MRVNSCRCAELFAGFQRWLRLKLKTDRQNREGERERGRECEKAISGANYARSCGNDIIG